MGRPSTTLGLKDAFTLSFFSGGRWKLDLNCLKSDLYALINAAATTKYLKQLP